MKTVMITALGFMLSSGLAYAADQPAVQGQSPSSPTSGPPTVLTDTECNGVWTAAVGRGDVLTGDEAGVYISDFKQADADQDGKISQTEFKEACKKGLVKTEHQESAKMGKATGTHPGNAGETPPVESGKMQGE